MPREDIFNIGFALSGAISAGAYTAGVLDYFFQALNAWEQAKQAYPSGTPQHSANVQVITGASAGAITGALGVVALARGLRPERFCPEEKQNTYSTVTGTRQDIRCVLPSLYETWVRLPRMVDPKGGIDLLSSEDLEKSEEASDDTAKEPRKDRTYTPSVMSVLNTRLLDESKRGLSPRRQRQPRCRRRAHHIPTSPKTCMCT